VSGPLGCGRLRPVLVGGPLRLLLPLSGASFRACAPDSHSLPCAPLPCDDATPNGTLRYVATAVTEIASLRAELSGPQEG
jgi:hypothetical protein